MSATLVASAASRKPWVDKRTVLRIAESHIRSTDPYLVLLGSVWIGCTVLLYTVGRYIHTWSEGCIT